MIVDQVRMIVSGPEKLLIALREDLAAVLEKHRCEVVEKGLPKQRQDGLHVIYLTGAVARQDVEADCAFEERDLLAVKDEPGKML